MNPLPPSPSPALDTTTVRMVWRGTIAAFMRDPTFAIDLEGAFRSGKTTAALWKVFNSCQEHAGVAWLICRYGDEDTQTKLKPVWRQICAMTQAGVRWDPRELCDQFPHGSRVYIFGLRSQDQLLRYAKLRGLTLAGIYVDQAEELPEDIFLELMGRLSQQGFPHQILLSPNPTDEHHWLAHHFPEDNQHPDRQYYSVSIYDNAHNLPPETIRHLEEAYPPGHANHRPAVLGKRGMSVRGEPVYGPGTRSPGVFVRATHVRPIELDPRWPLYEGIDYGQHHPCVVWAQYTPWGQKLLLGGLLGQDLYLEDFAPLIRQYRAQWFPNALEVLTCCDPAGSHHDSRGLRQNGVEVLREHGIYPLWQDDSNAPDVRLAMIERTAAYMRKRTPQGEAFGIDSRRWLRISHDQCVPFAFLADGCEAGYVWDEHLVSVGNKQMRRPKKDGWFDHGQNCSEYLERNFGLAQMTVAQAERGALRRQRLAAGLKQRDVDAYDKLRAWSQQRSGRRTPI